MNVTIHDLARLAGLNSSTISRALRNDPRVRQSTRDKIHALAEKYGYTPYYFSKKFKQEVGMSLRDFAAEKKVERAKILLTRSKMSISDVSEALGFNSQSYFGSVFRKLCGMTPSEYQLNHGGNKEANNE